MSTIRKYLMLMVKTGTGFIPKSLRNWLKRYPILLSFYSRNLQKSGLFYGFPSRKKLEQLYGANLIKQNATLLQCKSVTSINFNVMVIVSKGNVATLVDTLKSLTSLEDTNLSVFIMCHKSDFANCADFVSQDAFKNLRCKIITDLAELSNTSCFLIYGGDVIHPLCAHAIAHYRGPDDQLVYVDTDFLEIGQRVSPRFYPDWNPDLQLSSAYIRTGCWVSDVKLLQLYDFKGSAEGIALLLANLAVKQSPNILHIPLVLVHQTNSSALSMSRFSLALKAFLSEKSTIRLGSIHDVVSVSWTTEDTPLVSLIIPTKNGKQLVKACIESILEKTKYPNYEILLVDNNSDDPACLKYFDELSKHPKIRLLKYPYPFNYSAINNFAVEHAKGEVIGLVNNDIEVISPTWLDYMVGHSLRDDIGCVGAKLLYADERVQHAGVVMGYGGGAGHAHKYFPRYHPGYLNRLAATGNFSAVTAACLLVKKSDYLQVGGLNEKDLTVAFNDVDFCLKVLELGRRNLYCAEAELYHHESISRGFEDTTEKQQRFQAELHYLKTKWALNIAHDPAYNPNLTLRHENFSITET